MKLPERLDKAITKLYTAFHSGELEATDCAKCAAGNLVGSDSWARVFGCANSGDQHNKEYFDSCIDIYKNEPYRNRGMKEIKKTGYSSFEIFNVEAIFMDEQTGQKSMRKQDQFKGLCAVIEYLCELDNIPNVIDYQKFFEYNDNNEPKHELVC